MVMLMRTPLQRIRRGAIVTVVIFVIAVVGYRFLGGFDWVDAIWMVVITISTVGYGETSQFSPGLQMFTVAVIFFGMSAAAYTFGGFFQLALEGELDRLIGRRRMAQEIDQLRGHVVICGYGRIGQNLANDLRRQGRRLVIVDNDPQKIEEAVVQELLCMQGDATEEELLRSVQLERAQTLVTALPTDAANVFITLTARNLCPSIQIIARAEHQSTEKKLRQAGANRVVMPAIIGARQMVRMITRPSTADLMELVAESSFTDLELDEISISEGARLVGVTVGETEAHRRHRLLVVAIKSAAGEMIFNPDAAYTFQSEDVVMLMGQENDIHRFRNEYNL